MDAGQVIFGCFALASVVAIVAIAYGRSVNLRAHLRHGVELDTTPVTPRAQCAHSLDDHTPIGDVEDVELVQRVD